VLGHNEDTRGSIGLRSQMRSDFVRFTTGLGGERPWTSVNMPPADLCFREAESIDLVYAMIKAKWHIQNSPKTAAKPYNMM